MTSSVLAAPEVTGDAAVFDKRLVPILLVDDNPAKRLAMKAVLMPLGYPIVEADSGFAALRCIMDQDFAVILLDVRMPIMDGFETAALIRQRQQSEMTPIIFITAHDKDDIVTTDLYAEGAVDFIFAPVPPQEIRAKVSVFANLFIRAEELAARARDVQTSADQLKVVTDATPIGIFQVDAQKRYVYTNPRWAAIMGIPSDQAAGQAWDHNLNLERLAGPVFALDDGAPIQTELGQRFELRTPGETSRILLVTSKAIPDGDGGIAGWVGTVADVSSDARLEAALSDARDKATEASRLKSDFLANMSHEIRTPMNGVIGMTDLLLETELDDRQRDYAETVRISGETLMAIIDDILDFSKIEAGKLEIEEIGFNLKDTVDDVVALLAAPAQTKGLELSAVIESSVPAVVRGDPGRVRQVLINLIGNAIKFTQSGGVVLRVTEGEISGADAVVRFEVSDTGDGIAPDKLDTIFHPFVQADTSTSRKYGGTGLGLAITGQLVALMGGDCGVSSRLGEGSAFWFTITVGAGADLTEVTARRPSAALERGSGHLLLAEDNLINQKVAVAMLSTAGYEVDTVLNGAAAVQAVALHPYDTILMDCQMPELNGYEATAAIRAQEGSEKHTPIIAMTAGARPEDRARCMEEGMDAYLAKPVNKDNLLALVAQCVQHGPAMSALLQSVDPIAAPEITIGPAGLDELLDPPDAPPRSVLDPEIVGRLQRLGETAGEDLVGQLTLLYLADASGLIAALRLALTDEDAAAVGRSAHTLSGASANLGATDLARMCADLALNGAAGILEGCGPLLEAVETELALVSSALPMPRATP